MKKKDRRVILWSLTAGCWMLCDLKRGTAEYLREFVGPPAPTANPEAKL